jgi:Zn-dependent peptidase ImmA (M78 family)
MKIFVDTNLTKKEMRFLMKIISREYKVRELYFNNQSRVVDGLYNFTNSSIFINNKQTKKSMLRVFFHELAHHVAVKQNKWISYHNGSSTTLQSDEQFSIENKIDILARTLWFKHVNIKAWGNYKFVYPKAKKQELSKWLDRYNAVK